MEHVRSVIFRRVFPSLRGMIDRSRAIFNAEGESALRDSFNESLFRWKFDGGRRQLRFGSLQYEKDVLAWQGQPHDYYGFDEITEFSERQVRYVCTWNRTTIIGQRCRMVGTGNPPTAPEGRWVIKVWSPWLDDTHPNPAKPGELRYFITRDNQDFEVEGPAPVTFRGEQFKPKSRTFIPSSIRDNPFLMDTDYASTLHSLPEPLRSMFLYGDFKAGIEDDPYQLIPTAWVQRAQARWREMKEPEHLPLQQLGVDVARGGKDRTILSPRKGTWFGKQQVHKGITTKDGQAVATLVVQQAPRKGTIIGIDAIGVGASPLDFLRENGLSVMPIVGSAGTEALDKSGMLHFANVRSQIYWQFREALDPDGGDDLALPDDSELIADLCAVKFKVTARGIVVLSKDEIIELIGRSPDKGDSIVYAHAQVVVDGQGVMDYYKLLSDQKRQEERDKRNRDRVLAGLPPEEEDEGEEQEA